MDCGTMGIYKHYKTSFGFENYLDLLPLKFKNVLSKLRLSSQKLAIETGCYTENRVERNYGSSLSPRYE